MHFPVVSKKNPTLSFPVGGTAPSPSAPPSGRVLLELDDQLPCQDPLVSSLLPEAPAPSTFSTSPFPPNLALFSKS